MMIVDIRNLSEPTQTFHAEVQRKISVDTNDGVQVVVQPSTSLGFRAIAFDGPTRDDAHAMISGPWRSNICDALKALNTEWVRGAE